MFTVFYSWQSDIDSHLNRGLIRDALEKAQKKLNAKGMVFEVQESARGVPGSPDIANVILERIREADAVVSDVSIINSSFQIPDAFELRPSPNPNVLIELGFAAGVVGWERIIMVFNSGFGGRDGNAAVPKEVLPFDLGLKQVAPYNLPNDNAKLTEREKLAGLLTAALETIFLQAEKQKEFEPLLRFIIRKGAEQFGKHGDDIQSYFEQTFAEGNEHLLWAAQDEIVERSGEGSLRLLDEMKKAGLVEADKTNLGHKTWFISKKGLIVAKQSELFRATDPVLNLSFGDPSKRQSIGTNIVEKTILHDQHNPNDMPTHKGIGLGLDITGNREYWREFADYVRDKRAISPIWFVVKNHSGRLAANVRVVFEVAGENVILTTHPPEEPSHNRFASITSSIPSIAPNEIEVERLDGRFRVAIHLGSIQPKAEGWSEEPVYIGARNSDTLHLTATIFADNISDPQKSTLTIKMDVTPNSALTYEDLTSISEQDE